MCACAFICVCAFVDGQVGECVCVCVLTCFPPLQYYVIVNYREFFMEFTASHNESSI